MQCSYVKEDGSRCNAYSMEASDCCYLHNPNITPEEKRLAQSRGGQTAHVRFVSRLEPLELADGHSVMHLLADTINRVRMATPEGDIDTRTASVIAVLAGKMLEAQKVINLEVQLRELESEIGVRKSRDGKLSSFNEAELDEEIKKFLASVDEETETRIGQRT